MRKYFELFCFYVPYKFYKFSEGEKGLSAYLAMLALILVDSFFLYTLIGGFFSWSSIEFSDDRLINKYVVIPKLASPFVVMTLLFYFFNKERFRRKFEEYDSMTAQQKKMPNLFYYGVLVFSLLLLIISIISIYDTAPKG